MQLAEAQTNDTVTQVEPASVPGSPVRPKPLQSAMLAALVGAMVAAGGVVGIDALDDTMRDPTELSQRTGLPILGVIPFTKIEEKGLVTQLEPRSPISEAYRELRTNLQFSDAAKKLDRIVVTSPTPGDGKTTVASNLAVILAQSGRKVVLVDADLRRPMVHHVFDITSKPGLTGLFLKQVGIIEAARSVGVDNLVVVTSGVQSPNPAEMLGSERMKNLLGEIQQVAEVVILDTPPQLSVTDSSVLIPYYGWYYPGGAGRTDACFGGCTVSQQPAPVGRQRGWTGDQWGEIQQLALQLLLPQQVLYGLLLRSVLRCWGKRS